MAPNWMTRLALLVYAMGIVAVSLVPSSGGTTLWNLDKVGHFLAYAGLGLLIGINFKSGPTRVLGLICAVVLGASLELAQHFVPGRDMSLVDQAANTLGALTGVVVASRGARSVAD